MYTIFDYLKYYKDYDLSELNWNIMDDLLLSILVYMPLKSFNFKRFVTVIKEILELDKNNYKDLMSPRVFEVVDIIKNSKRYHNMKFYNFVNILDSKTQFGAMTIKLYGIKSISFRGTDQYVIGWLENFRIAYEYPTYTQNLAINYLNNNISIFDNTVYVGGHSKGGNLALVSSMELSKLKLSSIKKIYNFDGPGLRYNEYISDKYLKVKDRLVNIVPTGSYIGTLLYNENYQVVKSNAHAFNEHFPTSWNIFGITFVKGTLSKLSVNLIKRTTINMQTFDEEKIKQIFETAFKIFDKRETDKLKIGLKDIVNLIKTMDKMEPELSKYLGSVITTMIKLSD